MSQLETGDAAGRALYGHGLALEPVSDDSLGMDLRWQQAPGGRVLALVEGIDALAQDLRIALLTPTGTAPFNRGFGFDGLRVLTLSIPPHLTEELLRLAVIRTLASDGRVREVLDVRLDPVGPDRRQRVTAVVRVRSGETVELSAGEVELS